MTFVETLDPRALWRHFDRILSIPRGSKQEGRIRDYVIEVAERRGLEYEVDGAGNLVVRKPAGAGREAAEPVVLQSHLDMVNEKNTDVDHDFDRDAIRPRRDGEYLTASGTTLGSDNGIGVAAMLAIMEAEDIEHGPLELLFTIDEETGLTGALELEASLLRGRRLINLDSEEEGSLTVGCAGGGDITLLLPIAVGATPAGAAGLEVRLRGLRGGHSGIDIHLQRGNAVKLLARLANAAAATAPVQVASFEGGNKYNAIPREASAVLVVAEGDREGVRERLAAEMEAVELEHATSDPDMEMTVREVPPPAECWTLETSRTALRTLEALPHGVLAMSPDIPGLVETSTNVAVAGAAAGVFRIGSKARSSLDSSLEAVRRRIRAVGELVGAEIEEEDAYPGWKPNLESPLLATTCRVHREVLGQEPEVVAVHAGLECGIIGEKAPGMDMISFGPQIEFPHSPDERVRIESVGAFYRLLTATLERLAS